MNLLSNSNKDKIIKTIVDKLKKDYVPQKIILFGSYAYGNPTSESDIDILLIKNTSENPIKRRVTVRQILNIHDPTYPPLSLLVITPKELKSRLKIGDQFVKEIIENGVILYGK